MTDNKIKKFSILVFEWGCSVYRFDSNVPKWFESSWVEGRPGASYLEGYKPFTRSPWRWTGVEQKTNTNDLIQNALLLVILVIILSIYI